MARAWTIWAHFAGMALLSTGLAYLLIASISGDEAVVEVTGGPRGFPHHVRIGDALSYSLDITRREMCPGEVVNIWVSRGEQPVSVTTRRPVGTPSFGQRMDARVVVEIPPAVFSGDWTFQSGVDSQCPLRRQFDLTVPPRDIRILPRGER